MSDTLLTAIIPCKDELPNIEACINSLRGIADEILVADSGSTDGTLELVQSFSDCRVIEREYVNPSDFKNWAIPQATHEWILLLDADERVSPGLFQEVAEMKKATLAKTDISAYWIGRDNWFLGRRIRFSGWSHDGVVRLFRRECRYEPVRVHEEIDMSEIKVSKLKQRLVHNTYRSLSHYLEKIQRYSTWGAEEKFERGTRFKLIDLIFRPPLRFIRHYFINLGILDGIGGLAISNLVATEVFLKYAKLWELEQQTAEQPQKAETPLSKAA